MLDHPKVYTHVLEVRHLEKTSLEGRNLWLRMLRGARKLLHVFDLVGPQQYLSGYADSCFQTEIHEIPTHLEYAVNFESLCSKLQMLGLAGLSLGLHVVARERAHRAADTNKSAHV